MGDLLSDAELLDRAAEFLAANPAQIGRGTIPRAPHRPAVLFATKDDAARFFGQKATDAAICRYLEVSDGYIANVRAQRKTLSPWIRAALAELVGEDWLTYALHALGGAAKQKEARFWRKKLAELRGATAAAARAVVTTVALTASLVLSGPKPAEASPYQELRTETQGLGAELPFYTIRTVQDGDGS